MVAASGHVLWKIMAALDEIRSNCDIIGVGGGFEILAQGLIGMIEYSYQQVATSFPDAHSQRTPRLSVLGPDNLRMGD